MRKFLHSLTLCLKYHIFFQQRWDFYPLFTAGGCGQCSLDTQWVEGLGEAVLGGWSRAPWAGQAHGGDLSSPCLFGFHYRVRLLMIETSPCHVEQWHPRELCLVCVRNKCCHKMVWASLSLKWEEVIQEEFWRSSSSTEYAANWCQASSTCRAGGWTCPPLSPEVAWSRGS